MAVDSSISMKTRLIAHIETWRPYTVIWCGLLSFVGACFTIGDLPSPALSFLSIMIPITGWIAGLYLSDYIDQDLDTIQKAHRPIPSKRMKPNEALFMGGCFVFIGFVLTLFLGLSQLLFVFFAAVLVYSYARYTKSNGIIGNINRGMLAVVSYFFGVFAVSESFSMIPIYVWLLAVPFLLHDMTTNIIGTVRDVSGDEKAGYQTLPVKYGVKKTIYIVWFLISIWFSLIMIIPVLFQIANSSFYVMMLMEIIFLVSFVFVSLRLIKRFSREQALNLHKVFVLERITLASALLFMILQPLIAAIIFMISLFLTALFQIVLRNQYEFNKWTL